ncbi:hypothetical protein FBQ96_06460 [Nitrospirales bacterium NOB]|nr:hypothetical protein [Nitrospirales bacterium NOB]
MTARSSVQESGSDVFYQSSNEAGLFDNQSELSSTLDGPRRPLLYLDKLAPQYKSPIDTNHSRFREATADNRPLPELEVSAPPLVFPKPLPPQLDHFQPLQSWEGIVNKVEEKAFSTTLRERSRKAPDQVAEFPLEEVSLVDRELVKPGAIFYWDIGYSEDKTGQRIRASLIRFRRLPAWTKREIENARRDSSKMRENLGWE